MYPEYQKSKGESAPVKFKGERGGLVPTRPDIEGPFYKAGAPLWTPPDDPNLSVTGHVTDAAGRPVACALDIWQADAAGVYDNEGYKLRGVIDVGIDGSFAFETVVPGDYEIGPNEYRCAHVHAKVWREGRCVLTTQLYFSGDENNESDHWFDPSRVVGGVTDNHGEFDFVLDLSK